MRIKRKQQNGVNITTTGENWIPCMSVQTIYYSTTTKSPKIKCRKIGKTFFQICFFFRFEDIILMKIKISAREKYDRGRQKEQNMVDRVGGNHELYS